MQKTTATSRLVDRDEVINAFNTISKQAGPVEVRIMGAQTQSGARCNMSGVFDNAEACVNALIALANFEAVYMSGNRLKAEFLARKPMNELGPTTKGSCVGKADVENISLLRIDIDPQRESGMAATDAEKKRAQDVMEKVKTFLAEHGWTQPMEADSGNGYYLLYPAKLGLDAVKDLKRFMQALHNRFGTNDVHIDDSMAGPAQPMRLFGTMNRKGENTQERPHRMSRIETEGDVSALVTAEMILKIAPRPEKKARKRAKVRQQTSEWDIEALLEKHGGSHEDPKPYLDPETGEQVGKMWVLETCPWRPEHKNKSAFIIQFDEGAIVAKCHHNSCSKENFSTLLDKWEPSWHIREERGKYELNNEGTFRVYVNDLGVKLSMLANFSATILEDRTETDGVETTRSMILECILGRRTVKVELSADEFDLMKWPTQHLGMDAYIQPEHGAAQKVRAAIQLHSADSMQRSICYKHTGWVQIDGNYYYLHSAGAIGTEGTVKTTNTKLPEQMQAFELPDPVSGSELNQAALASMEFLNVVEDEVSVPVYGSMLRSVLGGADYTTWVEGPTGVAKTSVMMLIQQHFGAAFADYGPPSTWISTATANEAVAFTAKDAVLLCDDFAPDGSQQMMDRRDSDAGRVVRTVGNKIGRNRGNTDGSLRSQKPPRAQLLATGESHPKGHSVVARMLLLYMKKERTDWKLLTKLQQYACDGMFSKCMASYIQWLAGDLDSRRAKMKERVQELRAQFSGLAHKRAPDMLAQVAAGLELYAEFLQQKQIMTAEECQKFLQRCATALQSVGDRQDDYGKSESPAERVLELLRASLTTCDCYVVDISTGRMPRADGHWGWAKSHATDYDGIPVGKCIGWIDGVDLYLDPAATLAGVRMAAQRTGHPFPISSTRDLGGMLKENGLLMSWDDRRNRNTVRKTIHGSRHELLHISASCVYESDPSQGSHSSHIATHDNMLFSAVKGDNAVRIA